MINEREKCYTLGLNSKKYVQSEGGECVTRTYDHSNGEAFSTLILNEGIYRYMSEVELFRHVPGGVFVW